MTTMLGKNILSLFCIIVMTQMLSSQVILPAVIADNMVLQQKSHVALWGKAVPNTKVTVITDWNSKKYTVMVSTDSSWHVSVSTPEASYTPYHIQFKNGKTIDINNVLIGEVWLCCGQSNMEMPVKGFKGQPVMGSLEDISNSANNNLRCYTVKRISSIHKQWDCPGKWEIASPNTTGNFTATGYYFARQLQRVLNFPIAILHCSWGGSTIEAWMSAEVLNRFPDLKIPQTELENKIRWKSPSVLYNGMLNALIGYGIRGAIWYQGEANYTKYNVYANQFSAMHQDWIAKWGIGEFPIYFAQIAPFAYDPRNNCAFMRETQCHIAKNQPLTSMAVLMDLGDSLCIHPPFKREVGERLAYIAMARNYGFDNLAYESPEYKSFEKKDNKIFVQFDKAPMGLTSYNQPITAFQIAGEDKVFYPAIAKLTRQSLIIESPAVPNPIAVRYAFKNQKIGNLFGVNGLPVSSFRTDNWDEIK